jgi:hypothetical protein
MAVKGLAKGELWDHVSCVMPLGVAARHQGCADASPGGAVAPSIAPHRACRRRAPKVCLGWDSSPSNFRDFAEMGYPLHSGRSHPPSDVGRVPSPAVGPLASPPTAGRGRPTRSCQISSARAHRDLPRRVRMELGLPVDAPRAPEEGTAARFLRWHEGRVE